MPKDFPGTGPQYNFLPIIHIYIYIYQTCYLQIKHVLTADSTDLILSDQPGTLLQNFSVVSPLLLQNLVSSNADANLQRHHLHLIGTNATIQIDCKASVNQSSLYAKGTATTPYVKLHQSYLQSPSKRAKQEVQYFFEAISLLRAHKSFL